MAHGGEGIDAIGLIHSEIDENTMYCRTHRLSIRNKNIFTPKKYSLLKA